LGNRVALENRFTKSQLDVCGGGGPIVVKIFFCLQTPKSNRKDLDGDAPKRMTEKLRSGDHTTHCFLTSKKKTVHGVVLKKDCLENRLSEAFHRFY